MVILFIHYMYPYLFQKGPEPTTEQMENSWAQIQNSLTAGKARSGWSLSCCVSLLYLSLSLLSPP